MRFDVQHRGKTSCLGYSCWEFCPRIKTVTTLPCEIHTEVLFQKLTTIGRCQKCHRLIVRVVFEAEASGGSEQVVSPTLHFPLSPIPFPFPLDKSVGGRSDPVRGKFPGFPLQIPRCSLLPVLAYIRRVAWIMQYLKMTEHQNTRGGGKC